MNSVIHLLFKILLAIYILGQFQISGYVQSGLTSLFNTPFQGSRGLKKANCKVFVHPFFSAPSRLRLYQMSSSAAGRQAVLPPLKPFSFVRDELRPYAMELHSKDQAKEGKQTAQTPFTKWTPTRQNYLQFLVDSLQVYKTFESSISHHPKLVPLRNTGLERSHALEDDIEWMLQFDTSLTRPTCGQAGLNYADYIKNLIGKSLPRFICHYYNFYFAHTAGGRMIGLKMSELLLDRHTLKFFQWNGDLKTILEQTKDKIDNLATTWEDAERKDCLEETLATFEFGGSLMMYLNPH